jgi:hypothetical protein
MGHPTGADEKLTLEKTTAIPDVVPAATVGQLNRIV